MDITGNYRDCWAAYSKLPDNRKSQIPSSEHGINWANVHKRLIPQLIRKGLVFAKSSVSTKGLAFVLPDIVYMQFEDIVGTIAARERVSRDTLSVYTYELGKTVPHGQVRGLVAKRSIRFLVKDFATGFISGSNLPSGEKLDNAIRKSLGVR